MDAIILKNVYSVSVSSGLALLKKNVIKSCTPYTGNGPVGIFIAQYMDFLEGSGVVGGGGL